MESFFIRFHDRKLSSPTRKSCTLPHCLTSGRYSSFIVKILSCLETTGQW